MAKQETGDQPEYDPIDAIDPEKGTEVSEGAPEAPQSAYASKSREELEKMIDDQKSMIGRQSNEVGDVKRKLDDLQGQISAKNFVDGQVSQPEQAKPKEIDYFGDPASAIKQSIEDSPAIRQMQQENARLRADNAARDLQSRHNDADVLLTSDAFKNYIAQSPSRTQSYRHGMQSMDVSILNELLSDYKAANQTDSEVQQLKGQDRKQQVRRAATGSAQGSGEKAPGKQLSREDMVNLQVRDPERYRRLWAEGKIQEAYRSKVKI
jgi:hypothetical protein